ncbi:MAG: DUF2339 domain-containing protein [Gemmatimonadota bacterium]
MEDRERIERQELRLERLEARLEALETELSNVVSTLAALVHGRREGRAAPPARTRRRPVGSAGAAAEKAAPRPARDLEAWIGQNALLVVGVLALVTSVGLALKYAFDRGWISPEVRVVAGLSVGLAVGVYGESLLRKGLRRYGAGLLGAGAAIAYTAVWAAAGPFRFVAPAVGIGALLALTLGVFLVSLRHSEELLAALGAAGAFLAPLLLGRGESPELLLVYAALVAAAGGGASARRGWPTAFGVVLAGFYLVLSIAGAADANDLLLGSAVLVGGTAAVAVARRREWRGLEIASAVVAWSALLITAAGVEAGARWLLALGPAGLAALHAAPAVADRPLDRLLTPGDRAPRRTAALDLCLLGFAVVAWALVVTLAFGQSSSRTAAWALLAIGLAWLASAVWRRSPELVVAGLTTLAFAPWRGLEAEVRPAAWGGLVLLAVLLTRGPGLSLARAAALALLALAVLPLPDLEAVRPITDPAFTGTWPTVAWAVLAATVLAAGPVWARPDLRVERIGGIRQRAVLWTAAAAILLLAVTSEIDVLFRQTGRSAIAAGFTVSAWWLLFAGALLAWGFLRDVKGVRIGGLVAGGLALLKVVFVDLAFLVALYRVGSFALLAAAALLAARAYHRRAQREESDPGAE